jgi:hypothetical protein
MHSCDLEIGECAVSICPGLAAIIMVSRELNRLRHAQPSRGAIGLAILHNPLFLGQHFLPSTTTVFQKHQLPIETVS